MVHIVPLVSFKWFKYLLFWCFSETVNYQAFSTTVLPIDVLLTDLLPDIVILHLNVLSFSLRLGFHTYQLLFDCLHK